MPNRDFHSWRTNRPNFCSIDARAADICWCVWRAGVPGLIRPEETRTRPKADVGYCSCFTKSTHIAAPSRYAVGEFSPRKARGVSLWKEHGPWPARSPAAALFARDGAYPPPPGIVRPSITMCDLPPLDSTFGSLRAPTFAVSPPSAGEVDKNPKVQVRLTHGVTGPDDDIISRGRQPGPRRRPRSERTRIPPRVGPGDFCNPPRGRGRERLFQERDSANSPRPPDRLPSSTCPDAVLLLLCDRETSLVAPRWTPRTRVYASSFIHFLSSGVAGHHEVEKRLGQRLGEIREPIILSRRFFRNERTNEFSLLRPSNEMASFSGSLDFAIYPAHTFSGSVFWILPGFLRGLFGL